MGWRDDSEQARAAVGGDVIASDSEEGSWSGPSLQPDSESAVLDDGSSADFAASLAALSQLSASLGLESLLSLVATYAVQAIPGADGAGLTLLDRDRAVVIVKSHEFVQRIDDIQYSLNEGPCISAAGTGETMRSGSLGGDARWPRFGPRAGRLGVHSVLSLPLLVGGGVVGAMNVYAHDREAFDDEAERLGELFAVPAAITVHNAQLLARTTRLATQLQAALNTRPVIDQAIGILRSRNGIGADEAFQRLRTMSQNQHVKLSVLATSIVDEAVRRAQSRRDGRS